MAEQLLIRNLPSGTKAGIARRAEQHHRSMEAEARAILAEAAITQPQTGLDLLADLRPEADFDWEPPRSAIEVREVEF